MTLSEWILWITSTLFQGVMAWFMIWNDYKLTKLKEQQIELVKVANELQRKSRVVEPELVG